MGTPSGGRHPGRAWASPPAPPWATIFFGLYESSAILPKWSCYVAFYRRFIDDVFRIWVPHPCPNRNATLWQEFQTDMQGWHGLCWEFTNPSTTGNFMGLTLSITNDKIETSLYEKPQDLYLYIPPHSCHPKNMISGLICGNILRFHRLCSSLPDIRDKTSAFCQCLLDCGYNPDTIDPIITMAHCQASAYLYKTTDYNNQPPYHHRPQKNRSSSTSNTTHMTQNPKKSNVSGMNQLPIHHTKPLYITSRIDKTMRSQ